MNETSIIEEGFDVFVHDGDVKVGAVREVRPHSIVVFVENAGDFSVPKDAVHEVVAGKVVLNCARLDPKTKSAINHAHDLEDPRAMSGYPQDPAD